jgi:2'-5' RNA ligase
MAHSYFFAVLPNKSARDRAADAAALLITERRLQGQAVDRMKLHLTLHFIGRYDDPSAEIESIAIAAGDRIAGAAIALTLDHAVSFAKAFGRAPCVLATSSTPTALETMASMLRDATVHIAPAGQPSTPFRPHVTVIYSPDRIAEPVPIVPLAWPVMDVVLAHGTANQERYRIVRRWTLTQ